MIPAGKLIRKIIEGYPTKDPGLEIYTQATLVDYLCEDHILDLVLSELQAYKKKKLSESPEKNEARYLKELSDRLILPQYLLSLGTEEKLSERIKNSLKLLWNILVTHSKIAAEKDLLFKWLREICEKGSASVLEISDFFKNTMLTQENGVQNLTIEGILCFKALFQIINLAEGKLTRTVKSAVVASGGTTIAGRFVASFSNTYEEGKIMSAEYEYQTAKEPEKLEGVELLWEIAFNSGEEVAEKAVEFLIELHSNLAAELELGQIRKGSVFNYVE